MAYSIALSKRALLKYLGEDKEAPNKFLISIAGFLYVV